MVSALGKLRARAREVALALFVLATASAARTGEAQLERNASLIWMRDRGAESCIEEGELVRRVEEHAGVALRQHTDALVIEGRIAPRAYGRGFVARLALAGDASSARELSSRDPDCRALDDALVLVVAAAVETLAAARERAAPPAEAAHERTGSTYTPSSAPVRAPSPAQPAPPARASTARAPEPEPERAPLQTTEPKRAAPLAEPEVAQDVTEARAGRGLPRDRRLSPRLAVGPRLSLGLMPAAAAGGAIALVWPLLPSLRLEIGASLWPAGSRPTDRGAAYFQAARADVLGCPVWPLARAVSLVGCAGPSAGGLLARADFTGSSQRTSLRPLIGLSAWLFAELRMRDDDAFRVRAGLGAAHELWRDRFAARDALGRDVLLHRIAPWGVLAALELSAAL